MMLILYTKTVCPYCVQAKNYLQQKNINFREINIEEDSQARQFILSEGHRSVPQIYFNGKIFVPGGWTGLSKMTAEEIIDEIDLRVALIQESI